MIIKYEFANGEKTEVEVDDNIGTFIVESRKAEHAADEKNKYHCLSYDAIQYEGMDFATDITAEDELLKEGENIRFNNAFKKLSITQQRRLQMLSDGLSIREIARIEGSDHKSVLESINAGRKKFLKFF